MEYEISTIIELALQQGIWAILYIYLFFRMLSENREREERYHDFISLLSDNIEEGIQRIQNKLESMVPSKPQEENEEPELT